MEWITTIIPLLISLCSVCVSLFAVVINRQIAYRQTVFERTASSFESFLAAFSAVAYDPKNNAKRDNLTRAFYNAVIYASPDTRIGLNLFAERVLAARERDDIAALDEITPDLLSKMNRDLKEVWRGRYLREIELRNASTSESHERCQ